MNLKALMLSLFIVMSFVGMNSLGRFYMTEPMQIGKEFEMLAVVRNPSDKDLDDVNLKLYIYDQGIRITSNKFDLNDGDNKLARINWIVPEYVKPGVYLTKLSVGNDHYKDVKHIYLRIV